MQHPEIFDRVTGILKKYAKGDQVVESLEMETSILGELKVNSARLVDIVLDFEDEFGIEIEDEDADGITTVGDAVSLIAVKTAQAA